MTTKLLVGIIGIAAWTWLFIEVGFGVGIALLTAVWANNISLLYYFNGLQVYPNHQRSQPDSEQNQANG